LGNWAGVTQFDDDPVLAHRRLQGWLLGGTLLGVMLATRLLPMLFPLCAPL